jgi:hypothetical protein
MKFQLSTKQRPPGQFRPPEPLGARRFFMRSRPGPRCEASLWGLLASSVMAQINRKAPSRALANSTRATTRLPSSRFTGGKASVGVFCGHHGIRVALCRPWVYWRHRPAAGFGAPCPGPSPGRLAVRRRLPPERGGDCRPLLRRFEGA